MDSAIPAEKLREIFDRITREVTEDAAGIRLESGSAPRGDDLCTVHIGFKQGFRSSLSLRANTVMLTRLTRSILQAEDITPRDLEDVTKEYLNVVCGHIAQVLYRITRVASRFDVPAFYRGLFTPAGQREQFSLSYSDGQGAAAQLVHFIPDRTQAEGSSDHSGL